VAPRRHARANTTIGELLLVAGPVDEAAADGRPADALVGVYFPGHRYPPSPGSIGAEVAEGDDPLLGPAAGQLREYLAGDRRTFDVPIATAGDPFSERVWALLRAIPYGETTTYGALADQLGSRGLAQRVGQAVGHNPLSIVIPCHRVVGAGGSLTGFAGGLDRKRHLLDLEEPAHRKAARLF